MQLEECLSETSGECRSWLCDSTLCTSKFCCKSWQEVVFCLLRCKDRYRWKYAECICWQEDYVLRCWCRRNWANDIFNVIDWIRYTSILCYALICKINLSVFVKCYVLKESVSADRIVDVRLRLFVQVDNFCVAAAFEVEYTIVIPAVLVITDKETFWICGKCSFTCSGKSEEDSCVLTI